MTFADLVGSAGVLLLLLAFSANLFGLIRHTSRTYHALNLLGASLGCYASLLIAFFPFVVLEGAWALVALVALVRGPFGVSEVASS